MVNDSAGSNVVRPWKGLIERFEEFEPQQPAVSRSDHFFAQSGQLFKRRNALGIFVFVIAAERLYSRHFALGGDPSQPVKLTVFFDFIRVVRRRDKGDRTGQHERRDTGDGPWLLLANDAVDDDFTRHQVCAQFRLL